jgi:biopolymer transport protein ExbB/TolQ
MLAYLLDAFAGPSAFFMWTITATLALALAIFVERSWLLLRLRRCDRAAVRAALGRKDLDAALAAAGSGPVGEVLRAGREAQGAEAAWDAMSAASLRVEARLQARTPYLGTIGNVATMIGLLGNVLGIIIAFSSLGEASAEARAVHLSQGIATAMATTAYGLMVAIPALCAHAWLDQQARAYMAEIEALAGELCARLRAGC